MLLHEFIYLTYNLENLTNYLSDKNVICTKVECPVCGNNIIYNYNESYVMKCGNHYYKQIRGRKRQRKTCSFKVSVLHSSWFAQAHINLATACRLIAYFLIVNAPRLRLLMTECNITKKTAIDWTNFCRELLAQWIHDNNIQIGGLNKVVEIDETKVGRRKYHKGRIITGQWIFGGIDRETKKSFIIPVKNRKSETLIPIIRRHVAPGSIIHSDSWRAYDALQYDGYIHKKINHQENFVDPRTGAHTQNIERLWRDLKSVIPRYGTIENHYINYLAEFAFKKIYPLEERIDKFFNIMAYFYKPNRD